MSYTNSSRSRITEVPLRSLDLLGQEVQLLVEYTAHACHFISQNQYDTLNSYLRQLYSEVSVYVYKYSSARLTRCSYSKLT